MNFELEEGKILAEVEANIKNKKIGLAERAKRASELEIKLREFHESRGRKDLEDWKTEGIDLLGSWMSLIGMALLAITCMFTLCAAPLAVYRGFQCGNPKWILNGVFGIVFIILVVVILLII